MIVFLFMLCKWVKYFMFFLIVKCLYKLVLLDRNLIDLWLINGFLIILCLEIVILFLFGFKVVEIIFKVVVLLVLFGFNNFNILFLLYWKLMFFIEWKNFLFLWGFILFVLFFLWFFVSLNFFLSFVILIMCVFFVLV